NGELMAPRDQDDTWWENKIDTLVAQIGDYTLIYHDSDYLEQYGEQIGKKLSDTTPMFSGQNNYFFLLGNTVSGHAIMFRQTLKAYIFPFDERFYYDWWIAFVASSIGEIKYINIPLVHHRRHNKGITSGSGKDKEHPMAQLQQTKSVAFNIAWVTHLGEYPHARNKKDLSFIAKTLKDYTDGKKGWNYFYFAYKYIRYFNIPPLRKG